MNLSSITSAASLYNTSAISSRVSEAFAKPQERLAQQADSTRVQLSNFGAVKSATAQLETAASKLQDNKQLTSADSVVKAAQGFAEAVNNRQATVNRVNSDNARTGVTDDGKARVANNETRRTLEGAHGSNRDALQKIGISVDSNGSVKVDAQKLQSAFTANADQVRQTLNSVGKQVAEQSSQQLASTGAVGASISKLTERLGTIEQKQTDISTQQQQSQRAVQAQYQRQEQVQQVAQFGFAFTGASAYNRIFSS